jgi:hypothetical protein
MIIRWGTEKKRYGLPGDFIKIKYVAQSPGEKRDVSAKLRDAMQWFVPRCVFVVTFLALGAIDTLLFCR